jgi:hypothetical protein
MSTRRSLHDSDFYAWSLEQAALLRAGRIDEADLPAIAEEIESMGKTEKRELVSRLTVLLLHLLKWQAQPRRKAAIETKRREEDFPAQCPWSFAQAMDEGYLPE